MATDPFGAPAHPMALHTVLIPGLLCSPRLYEPMLGAVWQHGGVTVADTRRDDTMAGMARRLLDGAPERFALAGLSMGGYVALEVMRQAPERVRALALLSTSARPDTPEQTAARREQIAMARSGRYDELVQGAFPLVVDASNEQDDELRATLVAMSREVGPEVFCVQQEAVIGRADSRALLGSISCPTLVVHGAGDRLIAPENGAELAAGIADAEHLVLERCGHSPTLERPDAVGPAVGALLDRVG
jgi:pimeloyl-ACP methyl ester carboxylesterase